MKNDNKIYKIFLTLFVIGFAIWLGGTIIRTTIAFDLFVPTIQIELNPEYTNEERMYAIYIFATTALLVGTAYGIAAISAMFLGIKARKKFKEKGWLFMIFCLFVLTIPIQIYFMIQDYILANAVYYEKIDDFYNPIIQKYFVQRFQNVTANSLATISLLSALTCIMYAIWRPLDKNLSINDNFSTNDNFPISDSKQNNKEIINELENQETKN